MNNEKYTVTPSKSDTNIMNLMTSMSQKLGNIDSRISHLEKVFINNGYQQLHKDFAILDTLVKSGLSDLRGDFNSMSNKLSPIMESGLISRIKKVEDTLDYISRKVESNFEYVEKAKEHKWDVSKIILNILLVLIFAALVGVKISLL